MMVDDSAVVLEAGRLALEDAGFDVVTAENPLLVHAMMRKERPDLLLIDVNMPAANGDTVTKVATQYGLLGKQSNPPVVLYSDLPDRELAARAKECGAAGYIRKTGDEDKLVSEVRRFLPAR